MPVTRDPFLHDPDLEHCHRNLRQLDGLDLYPFLCM